MNITRLNFLESLPLVKSTISRSHFLSFDLQMSGILTEQLTSPSIIDSIQKRYEKQKQSINKFIPLQFGLSAFQVLPSHNKIIAYPFNFYIFPLTQPFETMRFSFHAGTMNFLTKNQFDFNKLFYEGIPYTSKEKLKLFEKQEDVNNFRQQLRRMKHIESPEVKAFHKIHLPIVDQWITSESQALDINIAYMKSQCYMLLKDKIQSKYANIPLSFEFDSEQFYKRCKMTIKKCTLQQKQAKDNVQSQSLQSNALFNEIFDQIIISKKPLIVHNGFLDMMHVYFRFLEELPSSWNQYKQKIHHLFPNLYDNKYLFANSPTLNHKTSLKMTGLENCFVAMRQLAKKEESEVSNNPVKIEIAEDFKQYHLDSLECHEAGFDSLMTGYSFLKGVTHLNQNINLLVDYQAFRAEQELIRNRIPMGSINIPFNFEANDEDTYCKDANPPIFFQTIMNQPVQQDKVSQFFSKNYGSINFYWTSRNMTQFCITFISQEIKDRFLSDTKLINNNGNILISNIQGTQFLVLTHEQHHKKMNNLISIEKGERKSVQ